MSRTAAVTPARRTHRGRFLVGASLAAGAVWAVRKFLASRDDAWTAHVPSTAPRTTPTGADTPDEPPVTDGYIGDEPPEGFAIKANALSRRYHVPGTPGYERSIADVWFATEEAAKKAGYLPSQVQ